MHAHAIAQVQPPTVGVHLIWSGFRPWLYSPGGWSIQRRTFKGRGEVSCDRLSFADINDLRTLFELRLSLGVLSYRKGPMPVPLNKVSAGAGFQGEIFTFNLYQSQPQVEVNLICGESFAFGLRAGKVVAAGGLQQGPNCTHTLTALAIETVVVYARDPRTLQFCVPSKPEEEAGWDNVPFIVKELQMPLRELLPALTSADAELAEAQSRIPPGTTLDPAAFKQLAETLRAGVQAAGPPRPIDQVLLLRDQVDADFEELIALDPLRVMLIHPSWRRALGFGFFDRDPALVVGETYEYRITGHFPAEDVEDQVYGFHTIPSQTQLPAEFYLHDLHLLLPQPIKVERAPLSTGNELRHITRRGIRLLPRQQSFWQLPFVLDDWSLVIDFPSPVETVILELHKTAHALKFMWLPESGGGLGGPETVPPEPNPRLAFPEPVKQLRLAGEGFLFAVRIPTGSTGLQNYSIVLPPVMLQNAPLPEPPLFAGIRNLQQPITAAESDLPTAEPFTRQALGFQVDWRPAPQPGVTVWPPEDDAAPPLDGTLYEIEQRQVILASDGLTIVDASAWEPVLPDENWVLGDRDEGIRTIRIHPRADAMLAYPEEPRRSAAAGLDVFFRDVFDFAESGDPIIRPVPPPGSFHQYRVRAIDAIGRPSPAWTETNVLRLEKRIPPPVPVGPNPPPAAQPALPLPSGVQARVLIKGAPDLTAAETTLLGSDDNAIVLRWGWRTEQRDQDPFAREFRIYATERPLDAIPGQLTAVTILSPGSYNVALDLERDIAANAAQGLILDAGYPFFIVSHTAGSTINVRLEARIPNENGDLPQPVAGSIQLPLRLTPTLTRPPAWTERVAIQPITADTSYQTVLRNRLTLSQDQPRDTIWVGVSSADDQDYVSDQLAPIATQPGNESAIVPVLCEGRFHGRPVFDVPPALDPVPVLTTPEPGGRPLFFELDLRPALAGSGLGTSDLMRPERLAADALAAAYFVSATGAVMARAIDPHDAGESDIELFVPNPGDRAAIVAALNEASTEALADRFVVFLAGSHPYRDRLFEPAAQVPLPFGPFQETLPAKSGRFVYRVRKSDRSGHLSAGAAMAAVVVRVPSLAPGAVPERDTFAAGDPPGRLRLRVVPDGALTHLLTFSQETESGGNGSGPVEDAYILRTPNRSDLYPEHGLWLRAPDGALLAPQVKALDEADVTLGADDLRRVALDFAAAPGRRVRVWACSLTRDGIPSLPAGPWTLAMPLPPLPEPVLEGVITSPGTINFSWSWPSSSGFEVALERSSDGSTWRRVSPLLDSLRTDHSYANPGPAASYRLRVYSLDGRQAHSNTITI